MRPRPHFDGAPDRFARTQALFPATSTLRVRWAEPRWIKFVLLKDARGRSLVGRMWTRLKRSA